MGIYRRLEYQLLKILKKDEYENEVHDHVIHLFS